jgi:hypothetical protein
MYAHKYNEEIFIPWKKLIEMTASDEVSALTLHNHHLIRNNNNNNNTEVVSGSG